MALIYPRRQVQANQRHELKRISLMNGSKAFARRVFLGAGIYGLIVLLPQYFMEGRFSRDFPPALTHPEHFYGFLGVAVAWQCAFLLIARDVERFRPFMLPAMVEKVSFVRPLLLP